MEELDNLFTWIEEQILKESVKYLAHNYNITNIRVLIIGDQQISLREVKDNVQKVYFINTKKLSDAINEVPVNLTNFENTVAKYKYHIIMCNMTIHPLFKEGRLLNSFMKLANHQLEDNGILTGVAIDGDKVMRLFVNREEINRGLYRLESLIDLEESKTPYGNDFELEVKGKKAIRHYTVTISELKEVAENNSFLFIGTMDFPTWFQKYQEKKYEALSKEQKEFAFLHFSYFFKKREIKN